MLFVDPEKVKFIEWSSDPIKYDLSLQSLGGKAQEFVVHNPNIPQELIKSLNKVPQTKRCVVWYYNNQWIAKRFTKSWKPEFGYYDVQLPKSSFKFNFLWTKNKDLGNLNFDFDPYRNYQPTLDESFYELVWYLDPKFNPTEDKIWAVKCKNQENPCLGIKDMGYISPHYEIVYNDDIRKVDYDIDFKIPWWELHYDYQWMLDRRHYEYTSKYMWAFKVKFTNNPTDTKIMGEVSPNLLIETNLDLPNLNYEIDYNIPYHDFGYEHIWMLDDRHCENAVEDIWAVKVRACESIEGSKIIGNISPILKIEGNPNLPDLNYEIDYVIPYHDLGYEHVWMLDPKHCENALEDIWAVKISATDNLMGTKIMGDVSPILKVEYNPALPVMNYEIEYNIPYHDLGYEHVWMLDPKHCINAPEEIYAFKISATDEPEGSKVVDFISPTPTVLINDDVRGYDLKLPDIDVQYHDFEYRHVWMLDKLYSANFDIWAAKIAYVNNVLGEKELGSISPKQRIIYNRDLRNLTKAKIDYKVPYHDRAYEHIWYLGAEHTAGEKIWAVKLLATRQPTGVKEMGRIELDMPNQLDVFFISYKEPNSEENWERVLEKAPWAKRIKNVKGIFEAHLAAANKSSTDMFYVVDGDAYLTDDWSFDYQPSIFDRDCAYVWLSVNPINDLTYGYGGVKLFAKENFLRIKKWTTLDMTTGIMPKLSVMSKVSNITAFNTDEYTTWRSAFRECVKLEYNSMLDTENSIHLERLAVWKTIGEDRPFGSIALEAADHAETFFKENKDNPKNLQKINDMDWLRNKYSKIYKRNPSVVRQSPRKN